MNLRFVLVPALCLAGLLACESGRAQHSSIDVRFLSIGQGDATLIHCPNDHYILIDAADTRYPQSSKLFRSAMEQEFQGKPRKLDLAVGSHAHADHLGSMQWVLENFEVNTYVDNGDKAETSLWSKLDKVRKKLLKQGKLEYINAKTAGSAEISVCPGADVSVEVFSPWSFSKKLTDPNDRSVVVRLTHGQISFLFVGDAHDNAEGVMLTQMDEKLRHDLAADVLKVGHHGSDTSSTAAFVMAVRPRMAVISSGKKDVGTNVQYKHPRASTLVTYTNWLKTTDKTLYTGSPFPSGKVWAFDNDKGWRQFARPDGLWLTTVDGDILVTSDGKKLDVKTH